MGLFSPDEMPEPPARRARGTVAAARATEEDHELAARLPSGLYLGTSSWSFPGWEGILWEGSESKGRLARQGLPAYAQHPLLTGVGIDRSYYQPLAAEEYAGYAAAVPRDFRFVVKAHEALTVSRWPDRDRYGSRRGQENPRFLDADYAAQEVVGPWVEGLGEKAGPLVFQFAPQDLGEPKRFVDRLYAFLSALPRGPLYAVELRNKEVLTPLYGQMLTGAGVLHCFNRHGRMPDLEAQARLLGMPVLDPGDGGNGRVDWATAPGFVCRWILRPGLTYQGGYQRYHPFDRLVDPDPGTRRTLAEVAVAMAGAGLPLFVTANNKAEGCAPLTIFELAREIGRRLEGTGADAPPPTPA